MSLNVSFKAVLLSEDRRTLLGRNPRQEWELLGGRPDPRDATPQETLRREFLEEAGLAIVVGPILDSWIYDLGNLGRICVVTYSATVTDEAPLQVSAEHSEVRWFSAHEALNASMPRGYKESIMCALATL